MITNVNEKYKTALCKHYELSGVCHMGAKCHFAHGKEELRINDPHMININMVKPQANPKPVNVQTVSSLPPTILNYKTMKCKYFEKGFCKFNQNCGFAHGDHELRSANSPLPSNILSVGATVKLPEVPQPTYNSGVQNQAPQQQILYLISQMEGYHVRNPEILAQIRQARELNSTGNVQLAASIIYNVINRPNKSKEDSNNYIIFVQNMQTTGQALYQQQLQPQYTQQVNPMSLFGLNQQTIPSQPIINTAQPLISFPGTTMSFTNQQVQQAESSPINMTQSLDGLHFRKPKQNNTNQVDMNSKIISGPNGNYGSMNPINMMAMNGNLTGLQQSMLGVDPNLLFKMQNMNINSKNFGV